MADKFVVAFAVMTAIFGILGGVCPFFVPRGKNRGLIQVMLILTSVCLYTFWLIAILMQLNPLFGPTLDNVVVSILKHEWALNDTLTSH